MNAGNQYIISGPKEEYLITFESFGRYLFDSLKKRASEDIIAIDAYTKERLTCGELLDKSIKLATALKNTIQKDDVVSVISENSLFYYTAICATLFCGAQLNVLNPAYTSGELIHVFKLAKPKLVFSSKTALQNVLSSKEEFDCIQSIILLENERAFDIPTVEELIQSVKVIDGFEPVKVNIKDTVVLCLSSGTTGLPKCVELSHENIMVFMNFTYDSRYLDISEKDTTVLILPIFHIYGFVMHLLGITNSLTVIVMKSFKPDVFLQAVEEYKATKLFLVPPLLLFLIKNPIVSKYNITSVEEIFIGAASLSNEIYEEAIQKFKYCTVIQMYATTEVGLCTFQDRTDKYPTIGKVVCNMTVKIVNIESNTILRPDEVGEICVKSASVMKGYLNNPSETENSFDNDGFYHTGDVGYYDKNKNFCIVGRIKELIKYKGFQVPPEEIENILLTHLSVQDCGVVGVQDEKCGELPLAFVVRQPNSEVTEDQLIKFVADNISVQKQLHGGVRFVEQIPRNSAGKILRKELAKIVPDKRH